MNLNQVKSFFSGAEPAASSIYSSELSKQQRERLHRRFDRLTRNTGLLTLADLSALPELQGNPYVPMIYALLCREAGKKSKGEEGGLGVVEFGRALESLNVGGGGGSGSAGDGGGGAGAVFRVLDSDGDGRLSLEELEGALRPVLSGGDDDSSGSSRSRSSTTIPPVLAAGAALQKHDADGDGRLSLPEFCSLLAAGGK